MRRSRLTLGVLTVILGWISTWPSHVAGNAAAPVSIAPEDFRYDPLALETRVISDLSAGAFTALGGSTPQDCVSQGTCICTGDWLNTQQFSLDDTYAGNVYRVKDDSVLTEFKLGLALAGNVDLYFSVHRRETSAAGDPYDAVWVSGARAGSGTGTAQFYSSGQINPPITLELGYDYALAVSWAPDVTIGRDNNVAYPVQFRDFDVIGHVTNVTPPGFPATVVADQITPALCAPPNCRHAFAMQLCIAPKLGACCSGGVCTDKLHADCSGTGSYFHGETTRCADVLCDFGACCLPCGDCNDDYTPEACSAEGGVNHWPTRPCPAPPDVEVLCPPVTGACCFETPDDPCLERCADDCAVQGGIYRGDGTTCEPNICKGACCFLPEDCISRRQSVCTALGGVYKGDGTKCSLLPPDEGCGGRGACCFGFEGSLDNCQGQVDRATCVAEVPGEVFAYLGDGRGCSPCGDLSDYIGCCLPDGTCVNTTVEFCDLDWVQGVDVDGDGVPFTCPAVCEVRACCYPNGDCEALTEYACGKRGGTWSADPGQTFCESGTCDLPTGACCLPGGSCSDGLTGSACSDPMGLNGIYLGDGTVCLPGLEGLECVGACCLGEPDSQGRTCLDAATGDECTGPIGGIYQGDGSKCDADDCGDNRGACCTKGGVCAFISAVACAGISGSFQGVGTQCEGSTTCPRGACCLAAGCGTRTAEGCTLDGGSYQGDGTVCGPGRCDLGPCCKDGICLDRKEEDCLAENGYFKGGGTCSESPGTCFDDTDCPLGETCRLELCADLPAGFCELGACCTADGQCEDNSVEFICADDPLGESFNSGALCVETECPQAWGCCLADETCTSVTETACDAGLKVCATGGTICGGDADCPGRCGAGPNLGGACDTDSDCDGFVCAADTCVPAGALFAGDGISCSVADLCLRGACCHPDGTCAADTIEVTCQGVLDEFRPGETCTTRACEPRGGCCRNNQCAVEPADECAAGGVYLGDGVDCFPGVCFVRVGACCELDGTCTNSVLDDDCADPFDIFEAGLTCQNIPPCARGSCCLDDITCEVTSALDCADAGGVYGGDGTSCDASCVLGGCCLPIEGETCQVTTVQACANAGGAFVGEGAQCAYTCSDSGASCDVANGDLDCAKACSISGDPCESDADCDVGHCNDAAAAECSVSQQNCTAGRCPDGTLCTLGVTNCGEVGFCAGTTTGCNVVQQNCDDRGVGNCANGTVCDLANPSCADLSTCVPAECVGGCQVPACIPDETCAPMESCAADACATGACCGLDGACVDGLIRAQCTSAAAEFHPAMLCDELDPPCAARGACCKSGLCTHETGQDCINVVTGIHGGDGKPCTEDLCVDSACCLPGGVCQPRTRLVCELQAGIYQNPDGAPTDCASVACARGSCCSAEGVCTGNTVISECTGPLDDFRIGDLQCAQPCSVRGACCIGAICTIEAEADCAGNYLGDGTSCDPNPCCPDGTIAWTDPPDGVTDARQPRSPDATLAQGIDVVVADGPSGASVDCWSLCETAVEDLSPNDIDGINEAAGGGGISTYTITLLRRITPGAVTTITYESTVPQTGTFTSLPADSDESGDSSTADIAALIACCYNGGCPSPSKYSCDIDHSGSITGEDALRLVDLLSDVEVFKGPWEGRTLDVSSPCP